MHKYIVVNSSSHNSCLFVCLHNVHGVIMLCNFKLEVIKSASQILVLMNCCHLYTSIV